MTDDINLREKAEHLMEMLEFEAEAGGYHLNPDTEMTLSLCEGLVQNIERFGYQGCPCRLLEGKKIEDLDLICPCDYRDDDLREYGCCYCALYVTEDVVEGKKEISSIPERRSDKKERLEEAKKRRKNYKEVGMKVWRCKVCGYLMMSEQPPPDECPVCRAKRDRFEAVELVPT